MNPYASHYRATARELIFKLRRLNVAVERSIRLRPARRKEARS